MARNSQSLILGDCVEAMQVFSDNTIDSFVTDPPYALGFMNKEFDTFSSPIAFQEFSFRWGREALRILKPGGHMVAFSSTRTYHRMVSGIENAGFEIRDTLMWIQGQGFPKSHNLPGGLGTALKPSFEPIVLARKPFTGTVAETVTGYGTGALNIGATRIGDDDEGRWPANVLVSHTDQCRVVGLRLIPGRTIRRPVDGMLPFGGGAGKEYATINFKDDMEKIWECAEECPVAELGESARYFYQPKVSVSERNAGCEEMEPTFAPTMSNGIGGTEHNPEDARPKMNIHPTLKPIDLMRWLCRLITPPGGTVLDCFLGSGSTGIAALLEGFDFIGIERERPYMEIAEARLKFWQEYGERGLEIVAERDKKLQAAAQERQRQKDLGQLSLL